MVVISPLLNILGRSIRTIRKFVLRDFYEIEKLQSSIKKNNHLSIAVSRIPNKGLGKTINDRLIRASKFCF